MFYYIALGFLCLIPSAIESVFSSLSQVVSYAQALPEFPKNEYVEPYVPRFTSLHSMLPPKGNSFGVSGSWMEGINQTLQSITSERQLKGMYGSFVQKISIDRETKWYIWGALHGAFHSLVRGLQFLYEKEVLDESLTITDDKYYIVFNGSILNYAPYQLESLVLLLTLLEKNKGQVFITKGAFEQAGIWQETNLRYELVERLSLHSKGNHSSIPLEDEIDAFFNTLPLALYLISRDDHIFAISFFQEHPLLREDRWGEFFNDASLKVVKIADIPIDADAQPIIGARISSHEVKELPYEIKDMTFYTSNGTYVWELFSSPLLMFKRMFSFFHDVCALLTAGRVFSNWSLELYRRNVKDPDGQFYRARSFDISQGLETFTADQDEQIEHLKKNIELATLEQQRLRNACSTDQVGKEGIQDQVPDEAQGEPQAKQDKQTPLVVATMSDFSRGLKVWSQSFEAGLSLPIRLANELLSIGYPIQFLLLDDQYIPSLARKNALKFVNTLEGQVMLGAKGTATLASYIDLVKEKKLLVVFPSTGAFRVDDVPYILHLRASYDDEGQAVTEYVLHREQVPKRFAFLFQNDDYGLSLLRGAKRVLDQMQDVQTLELSHEAYATDFSETVQQIQDFNPDVIALFGLSDVAQRIMKGLGAHYLHEKIIMGNDRLGLPLFEDFVRQMGASVIIPHVVPRPDGDSEIAKEFRDAAHMHDIIIDPISFEGYIDASLFVHILQNLNGTFDKDAFVKKVEALKNYSYKGLELDFDPQTRQLMHSVWIDAGEGEWVEKKIMGSSQQHDNNKE